MLKIMIFLSPAFSAFLRSERRWLVGSIAAACMVNVGAIAYYGTRWVELVTQLPSVCVFAGILYLVCGFLRLCLRPLCCDRTPKKK